MVPQLEGILKIANLMLSVIAGVLAITLIKSSEKKDLRPWLILIAALVLFAVQAILGALRAFNIFSSPYLTHLVPTIILILVLWAISAQLKISGEP